MFFTYKEISNGKILEDIFHPFLKQFKHLDLKGIKIQTGNGGEFSNNYMRTMGQSAKKNSFTLYVEANFKKHKVILPACPKFDSDVETFHRLIERDYLA